MDNYNPLLVERKWQSFFEKEKIFLTKRDKKKKILLSGNVSISIRKHTYGPCKKLYPW